MKKRNDKTSPRGMAPDMAHGSHDVAGSRRSMDTDETFANSSRNAGATQTRRLK